MECSRYVAGKCFWFFVPLYWLTNNNENKNEKQTSMTEKEKEYRMVSRAFTSLGFQSRRTSKYRGYIVVRRSTSEMQQHRQLQNVDLESGGVVE